MLAKRLTLGGAWIAGVCNQATNRSKSRLEDAMSLPYENDVSLYVELSATLTKVTAEGACIAPSSANRI
jgi:hypothetical protein